MERAVGALSLTGALQTLLVHSFPSDSHGVKSMSRLHICAHVLRRMEAEAEEQRCEE